MKKLSILFLTILLLAGMTGCGNKAANNPITLTMWHVYGSQTESPLNTMIDEFNQTTGKENGIFVSVVSVTNSSAIDDALIASAHNEPGAVSMPDLFTAYPRVVEEIGLDRFWIGGISFCRGTFCLCGCISGRRHHRWTSGYAAHRQIDRAAVPEQNDLRPFFHGHRRISGRSSPF